MVILLVSFSYGQQKHLPETTVLKIAEKKYNSLRKVLKDSLATGISNVNDYSFSFSTEEKVRLDSLIRNFKTQTGFRLVVFTLDSLMTAKDSVQEVTQIIGIKNQINTTVGICFPYRLIYIWNDSLINNTVLDEYETKTIIDEKFVPFFKDGKYFIGTFEGIKAIVQTIESKRKTKSLFKKEFPKAGS